jgi:hypothetical protein
VNASEVVITRRAIRVRLAEIALLHVQGIDPCQNYPGTFRMQANAMADSTPVMLTISDEAVRVYEELTEEAERIRLFDLPGYPVSRPRHS